ncbi:MULTISPECIES: CoA ester lyase [unclassified Saccharopolyspora]|uniref:HpcH/HpaI aldolase/citrate lyase family protein n=1 Tax=unclassified Saccharopolyspora TaxID=2646250 RepID=UPI001CD21A2E|nr:MULTISPECIES: CoA ester lyase [unclassified Saccharopolyspora]MCA1185336.1 CoA ester lyase [Saccharopolyspora sp. 6T]MCA1194253.1 CoA ester lyase [Saccharopolyspora sp. 6V]MCA1224675.1 CoA ester lyase [Saccharopolyspora sp. 6M]MCA1279397.1 CoA ester lyase [Saccharopolyspora sp. 7B]
MTPPVCSLYVPGDRPERFGKAAASGADVVILDLEDAVGAEHKDVAREHVRAHLAERRPGPELHVRINDPATERGRADLAALAECPGLDAVRVPKIHGARDLAVVDEAFGTRPTPVQALLESARGLADAAAICAHPRVAGVGLGEQDLAAELSITDERAFDHLRLQLVLAAAAAGLPPVAMSVHADVHDEAGLRASCAHGRSLGMFGRAAIHPRQVPVIRDAFRPTPEEVARAGEVVAAAEHHGGEGALALPDGRFVDAPVIAKARSVLALADRLGERG